MKQNIPTVCTGIWCRIVLKFYVTTTNNKRPTCTLNASAPPNSATPVMAILITDQQFLILGLESAGFTGWERTSNARNVERFRCCWYGPRPKCCEKIWFDLQNSAECWIGSDANPLLFLLALRFLKEYPTETELAGTFAMSEKTDFISRPENSAAKRRKGEKEDRQWLNCKTYYTAYYSGTHICFLKH